MQASAQYARVMMLIALGLAAAIWNAPATAATTIARIAPMGVSPRAVAESPSDIFDEVSSGLTAVGVGEKLYLRGEANHGSTVGGYQWTVLSRPSGSVVWVSAGEGEIVTLRPDKVGAYVVQMTPLTETMQTTTPTQIRLIAANYAGAGTFKDGNPVAPQCGTGFCHGGSNAKAHLNVAPEWLQSAHAKKLQSDMSGGVDHYSVSCLPCHTVGYGAGSNNGFDDVAASLGYDVAQIPELVHDAYVNQKNNFTQLPSQLRNLGSIQCESCHGAGSYHPAHLAEPGKGIGGVDLGTGQCGQCHDSASGFQQGFYQWSNSSHPVTTQIDIGGHVAENTGCIKCHTGEGFVQVQVNKQAPTLTEHPHGVTCATCHDPHHSGNQAQLRLVGDFTFDSGQATTSAGAGGLCMRCHNSRVSNPASTVNSFRGVHRGPQSDMLYGINGWDFGMPFASNSSHAARVPDTCVGCHMAPGTESGRGVTEPPLVGEHTYAMRDDQGTDDPSDDILNVANACTICHSTVTDNYDRRARGDYDGDGVREGVQSEIQGLSDILEAQILATMPGTSVDVPARNRIAIGQTDFGKLSAAQRQGLYNYNLVRGDGSMGVHNTSYAVQLLQRSYYAITGRYISSDYPAMTLRGPVQRASSGDWALYQ